MNLQEKLGLENIRFSKRQVILVGVIFALLVISLYTLAEKSSQDPTLKFEWESFNQLTTKNICSKVSQGNSEHSTYNTEILRKTVNMGRRDSTVLCITEDRQSWLVFRFIENPHNNEKTIELISSSN